MTSKDDATATRERARSLNRRWRVVDLDLVKQAYADGIVVYSPLSGDTHLLGPAQICALEHFKAGPANAAEVAAALRHHLDLPDDDELPALIETMLATLQAFQLIELETP